MVISEQFIDEVDGVVADESLVIGVDETVPVLLRKSSQDVVVQLVEFDVIFV